MRRKTYRRWTKEEEEMLIARHGTFSLKSTAKKLDRTLQAVQLKLFRMGLTNNKDAFDYVIKKTLADTLGVNSKTIEYFATQGLRIRKKITCKVKRYNFIAIADFWDWSSKNKELIDWTKLEKNALGKEPDWVDEERRKILLNKRPSKIRGKWTEKEEKKLLSLYNSKNYKEIAVIMGRTESSIMQKIGKLNGTKRKRREWTIKEIATLKELLKQGLSDIEIADKLDRRKSSITTKRLFLERKGDLN
ncbi:hypothetical protein VB566_00240 [Clostridium perfringens]|uniref:hypothetical protein n=1 Tax=Clostridium perfringens TaxID=1502 RepID=UPI002B1EF24C|nr:hypothetical protein [Clostridium perfringens]MEA5269382.1 hypothetical protein [Clostridium perfringens]MEA5309315.1 hypothetical protein [Clostridium perfringens]MEA5339862.1 hypothetical protein [Clostridium perfringens]